VSGSYIIEDKDRSGEDFFDEIPLTGFKVIEEFRPIDEVRL